MLGKTPSLSSVTPSVADSEEPDAAAATHKTKLKFESELKDGLEELDNPKKLSFEEEFLRGADEPRNNNNAAEGEASEGAEGRWKKKSSGGGKGEYESSKKKRGIQEAETGRKSMAHLSFDERNHLFAENVEKNFRPIKYLLMALGRFPLSCTINQDYTRTYEWSWLDFNGIYFLFVTFMTFYILIIGSWNMLDIVKDVSGRREGDDKTDIKYEYEEVILIRHITTFVVLWTSLLQCAIASLSIIFKRNHFALYMSFWTRAVQNIHNNAAEGIFRTSMVMSVGYVLIMVILVLFSLTRLAPTATSSPTLFGILMFREYIPPLYTSKWRNVTLPKPIVQPILINLNTTPKEEVEIKEQEVGARMFITIVGGVFLVLMYAASKAFMFMFIYHCKLLKNAFANWNGRVYAGILMGGPEEQSSKEGMTAFNLLFRDHCVLLDMIEATDLLYSGVLESYFALQICSVCAELYFFIRTARFGSNRWDGPTEGYFIRPDDWAPGIIVFILGLSLLILVILSAAEVGEEAMAGLEVLRRKSLMGRKTDDELYFMLSMFSSYTAYKRIELTAGGYFYLNKELLIGVFATFLSYFIIVQQFRPMLDLSMSTPPDVKHRQLVGEFLTQFEGIEAGHYLKSTARPI